MPPTQGRLHERILYSRALVRQMRLHLTLPPRYDDLALRYPVLYLLHPWGEDERFFTQRLRFHETLDRLIQAGTIPPFITAMPQGDKSFFINAEDPGGDFGMITRLDPTFYAGALEGYGDYGDYLLQDVIPTIEQNYRVRSDRAGRSIAGVGMGASGAAILAFSNPQVFGAVGIHSPLLYTAERLGPPWLFGFGDAAAFAKRDPIQLVERLRPEDGLRIAIDGGAEEGDSEDPLADLHYALVGRDIPHTYIHHTGGQSGAHWRDNLAAHLGFYTAGWQ